MSRIAFAATLAVVLAGCAGDRPAPIAKAPPQRAPQAQAQAQAQAKPVRLPQRAPSPAVSDPGEAVWHLRAGLNVAALSCRGRGRVSVTGDYSKLLNRHRGLLASAYAGEQRRHGKGLDRHLTQVYNRFAYQPQASKFCSDAAAVAAEANKMDSAALSGQARKLLGRLG